MRSALALIVFLVAGQSYAERTIADIAYPISLLGTEMVSEDKKGETGSVLVVTRAEIIQGAYPESLFTAVAAPVRFALAGAGFPEESNVIVLAKIGVEATWGETEHSLVIDATKVKDTEEELSISPEKLLKVVMKAMQKTLNANQEMADGKPIRVTYKLPEGVKGGGLPDVLLPKEKKNPS